jgi:alkanesulfonate monooxygenase SsuD/methylene tetrahydromethanopterin reductase-like flavin-dependent oxidoreductase (luciferase family)
MLRLTDTRPSPSLPAARHASRNAAICSACWMCSGWPLSSNLRVEVIMCIPSRAAQAAGRDPASLRYGVYVTCVLNDDPAAARDAVRGSATTFARFSALPGSRLERLPPALRRAAEHIRAHYDMRDHTRTGVAHTAGIPDEFVPIGVMPVGRPIPDVRSPSLKRGWVPFEQFARWERW